MKKATRILIFACLALAGAAVAQSVQAQMYWRFDTGWSRANNADFKDNDFNNSGNICSDLTCTQAGSVGKISGSPIIGAGVGYRFSGSLRGDATFAYRGFYSLNEFEGDAFYQAEIKSMVFMVNGYYDFTAVGVRPYIGAGIGWARNETERLSQDFGFGFANTFSGTTKDNAAFALMAGVSIPYSGWKLDVGYRYIDLGKFGTGTVAAFGITGGHTGKLSAHELTLGVRF